MGNYTREQYHSYLNRPKWRSEFARQGAYFGVELELEPMVGSSYHTILAAMPDVGGRRPLTEHDASLSYHGVEIIFPPITLSSYKNKNSVFRRVLDSLHGSTRTTYACGMHVSVNRNGWTSTQVQRFTAILHNLPPEWLQNIGGRQLNRYCSQMRRASLDSYNSLYYHMYCAEPGRSRIECRFPAATTDHVRVTNIIEFLTLVRDFVHNHSDKWDAPVVTFRSGYGETFDYSSVLQNFTAFLLSTKQGKKIGSILQNGYPRRATRVS